MVLMTQILILFYFLFSYINFWYRLCFKMIMFFSFHHFFHLFVKSLMLIRRPFFKYFHILFTNTKNCLNSFKGIIVRFFSSWYLDILTISSFNKLLFLFLDFWVGNKFNLQFFRGLTDFSFLSILWRRQRLTFLSKDLDFKFFILLKTVPIVVLLSF